MVCVMFHIIEICYRGFGKKMQLFLQSLICPNLLLLMVEELFILLFNNLFYLFNESGIKVSVLIAMLDKTFNRCFGTNPITCCYLCSVALDTLYCHTI